ncbi:MAG TPA: MraY family glycosyltransferase [Streptosporangiaceae bacterium]|nr:MraY family glycosyltransferase [Streptosporangiaceae bacterium]
MREYVLTLLVAAAVTYVLTPLVRRFAIAVGAMHAARDRDVHVVPTPLLGGFAMYAGLAAGLVVASQLPSLNSVFADTNMAKGLLLAGGLVVVMGFVDDRWGMGVISKLAGQVAAGVILVWSGAEVTWLPAPHGTTLGLTSDQQIAVTILVVVITINAVNFIDGLDGLAAGIVGIGAAAFFAYYFTLTHRLGLPDQAGPALASAILAGICLGFLPHNYHPARIFMGDTGAMLIGLLLAYAPISSLASLDPGSLTNYASGTAINRFGAILPLLLPAAIMLIPYADLLMAVIRRARRGMSPFAPDRKHLHHRMLDIGHSHRTSVLIMYLWAALFAGSVVWLSIVQTPLIVLVIVTVGAMLVLLFVSMPRLRPWARAAAQPATGPGAAGEGGAPSATASPTGAHARRPAARASARTDPAARTPARTDRTPAPSAQAPRPARPSVPAAASPSGPAGSAGWLPAPPSPPEAPLHPAARDTAPGTGSPGGAHLASWPGGPPEPTPSPWPSTPQEAPPRPPASQEHSSPWPPSPQESPSWPSSPEASSPPWPASPQPSSSPWPAASPPSSPLRPDGSPESSPPWPPAPPAPSTRPKL